MDFQIEVVINSDDVRQEIGILSKSLPPNAIINENGPKPINECVMDWVRIVCHLQGMEIGDVDNLGQGDNWKNGRIIAALIFHYNPTAFDLRGIVNNLRSPIGD